MLVWTYNIRQTGPTIGQYYIGTGIITDYYRTDRYIVDIKDVSYIIRTEDVFHIGDEIFFQAYHTPGYDA